MHRFTPLSLLSLLPLALGCANPDTNECAYYMSNYAATASAFCATFTQSSVTETTDLPSWATACEMKPKHISKECSCYFTAGGDVADATTAEAVDTPVQTEAPVQTQTPVQTEAPEQSETPVQSEVASTFDTVVATTTPVQEAETSTATPAASTSASSSSGSGSSTCGSASEDELVGYGDGTTGGGSGTGTTVTTCSELESAAAAGGVITISGILSDCDIIELVSDTTVIGSGSNSGLTGGGFRLKDIENVILRNLKLNDAPESKDLIDIESSTYIWVDHCDLSAEGLTGDKDYYDGLLDMKRAADYVTVSWTKFSDHWKASLIGHSDSNEAEDSGHLRVTYHHNYWSNINSRTPSIRFGTAHVYSSCYEDIPTSGVHSRMGAVVLVEQCAFSSVENAIITNLDSDEDGYAVSKNNVFTDSTTSITQGKDLTVPYDYT